jgi:hypothetical protein
MNVGITIPSWQHVANEVLLNIVTKTKEKYVFQAFASYITYTTSFDLWMLYANYKMFTMVVSFIKSSWEHMHMIVRILRCKILLVQSWKTRLKLYLIHLVCLTKSLFMSKTKVQISTHRPMPSSMYFLVLPFNYLPHF